jgi:hypothetical protein
VLTDRWHTHLVAKVTGEGKSSFVSFRIGNSVVCCSNFGQNSLTGNFPSFFASMTSIVTLYAALLGQLCASFASDAQPKQVVAREPVYRHTSRYHHADAIIAIAVRCLQSPLLLAAAASAAAVAVIGGNGAPPLVMGQERDVELARGRRVRGCANEPHVRWMPTSPSLHLSTCPPVRTCLPFACLFAGSPACLPACKPAGLPSLAYVHVQTRTNAQTHAHRHAQRHTRTHRHLQTDG